MKILRTFARQRAALNLGLLLLSSTLSATILLKNYVNDFANVLSPDTRQILTEKLEALDREDSTQMVVVTMDHLQGQDINTLSHQIAQRNGIGTKAHNNGALLLLAVKDRQMRIEVGKGLEGRLTDWMAGEIIDNTLRPHYARGDFNTGTIEGVNAMIRAVKGEYQAPVFAFNPIRVLATVFFVGFMVMSTVDCHGHNFYRVCENPSKKTEGSVGSQSMSKAMALELDKALTRALEKRKGRLGYTPEYRFLALWSLAAGICTLTQGVSNPYQLWIIPLVLSTLVLILLAVLLQRRIEEFFESFHTVGSPHVIQGTGASDRTSYYGYRHRGHSTPKQVTAKSIFSGKGGSFGGGGARGSF